MEIFKHLGVIEIYLMCLWLSITFVLAIKYFVFGKEITESESKFYTYFTIAYVICFSAAIIIKITTNINL